MDASFDNLLFETEGQVAGHSGTMKHLDFTVKALTHAPRIFFAYIIAPGYLEPIVRQHVAATSLLTV